MGADNANAVLYAQVGDGSAIPEWIGKAIEVDAPFPVEAGRIADYCSLIEDANPIYWDTDLAIARYGAPIAPPAMLTGWRQPSPWHPKGRPAHGPVLAPEIPLPVDTLINAGFSCQFKGPMRLGDRLKYIDRCLSISDPKLTSLGTGYFIRTECSVVNQEGVEIATYQNNMFRYRKQGEPAKRPPSTERPWEDAPNEMPDVAVAVTPTLIALLTAGTRDYFPGHHDDAYAKAQGAPGPYPNTGTYCGLMDRVATEWANYDATVVARDLKMFAQAEIGRTLHSNGRVVARRDGQADLEIHLSTDVALIATAAITLQF